LYGDRQHQITGMIAPRSPPHRAALMRSMRELTDLELFALSPVDHRVDVVFKRPEPILTLVRGHAVHPQEASAAASLPTPTARPNA